MNKPGPVIAILLLSAWASHAQTPLPADAQIKLERTTDAFGNGTNYTVTISADGTAVFEWFANPSLTVSDPRSLARKTIRTTIPVEKVGALVAEVERIKYFLLKDRYFTLEDGCPNRWTDNSWAITSITIGGKSKTIAHYQGCRFEPFGPAYPLELTAFEKKIDGVIETNRWLK